jgi:hypothetical protein
MAHILADLLTCGNHQSASVSFPFPQARFSDLSCIFAFPTLVNNQSESDHRIYSRKLLLVNANDTF